MQKEWDKNEIYIIISICVIYCGIIRTLGTVHCTVILDKNMLKYKLLWV